MREVLRTVLRVTLLRCPNCGLGRLVALFAIGFPIAFYRHSRALWIGIIHLAGFVHRDDAAEPEPVIRPWPPDGATYLRR